MKFNREITNIMLFFLQVPRMWKLLKLTGDEILIRVISPAVMFLITFIITYIRGFYFSGYKSNQYVVYNSLIRLVLHPIIILMFGVFCCFILFLIHVLYTCSNVSWSIHSFKRDNKKHNLNFLSLTEFIRWVLWSTYFV